MTDAYYRSLYFSLDSPEDLELLGLLFALPRWRQPSAIKSALRQYLPTILEGVPVGPDEVRAIVGRPGRVRKRRRAINQSSTSSQPSTAAEESPAQQIPEPDAAISRAKDSPDLETAKRLLENRLDELMKGRWIG